MAFVNTSSREIVLKIAYHGPGLGGKTTNLREISGALPAERRGELLTLDTATERTLFFDFLLVRVGTVHGWDLRLHLYTVPGQLYYDASRKLILKGVDAIVFVIDSQPARLVENEQSRHLLVRDLREVGIRAETVPLVVQYNKRDLPDALDVADLEARFNSAGAPHHEAIARHGIGVMETLRTVTGLAVERLAAPSASVT